MVVNKGVGYLSTLTVGDIWANFVCGVQDPSTPTMSSMCANFWDKMANYPTPSSSIIPGPNVPSGALTSPYAPSQDFIPTIDPGGNISSFFNSLIVPTEGIDFGPIFTIGLVVAGVLILKKVL